MESVTEMRNERVSSLSIKILNPWILFEILDIYNCIQQIFWNIFIWIFKKGGYFNVDTQPYEIFILKSFEV